MDSEKSIHRAQVKQRLSPVGDRKRSHSEEGKKSKNVRIDLTSVDLAHLETERLKNNERHLKVIEDQMIKSKQDERALKRSEGDVKKDQRQIRQNIREFDTGSKLKLLLQ